MSTPNSGQAANAGPVDAFPPLEGDPSLDDLGKQLDGILSGEPDESPKEPEPPKDDPKLEGDPPKAEDEPKGEQEPPKKETEPEEPKRILPHRISTGQFDEIEQEALALRYELKERGETVSVKEAIEMVERRRANAPKQEPQPSASEELAQLEAELAQEQQKRDEMAKTLGIDEYKSQEDKLKELAAKRDSLLRKEQESVEAENAEFARARNESVANAKKEYPSASDRNSALGKGVEAEIARLRALPDNDPAKRILTAAEAPEVLTERVAKQIAQQLASKNQTSFASEFAKLRGESAAEAEPQRKNPPVAGGAQSTPSGAADAPKDLDLASEDSFDLDVLEQVLPTGKPGGKGLMIRG